MSNGSSTGDRRLGAADLADPTERYRGRARGIAALAAAAAAALVVGLVLTPSDAIPTSALVFGVLAVLLLIASTIALVIASALRYDRVEGKVVRVARSVFLPWRTSVSSDATAAAATDNGRLGALQLRSRVGTWMDWGMGLAGAAMLCLAVSVGFTFADGARQTRWIVVPTVEMTIPACPNLEKKFLADITGRDLRGSSALIELSIMDDSCSEGPTVVQVPRTSIVLVAPVD